MPDIKLFPNWKLHGFLRHFANISPKAAHLPENNAVDEQTIRFQGGSTNKGRHKEKRVGDGFQADTICNSGYTYGFYFRHQPPPEKYTKKGLSPLHARVMFLFDMLRETYHSFYMDNLYMSALFAKHAIQSKNKVKIHGVTRNHLKGIPSIIQQTEKITSN